MSSAEVVAGQEYSLITDSPAETLRWAEDFAAGLQPGDVVALYGELGAGKTVIAKGIGRGLGVKEEIISPTFNYVLEYSGRLKLFHADLYRVETIEAFRALGLDEYFDRGGVLMIEWAERVRGLLPPDTIHVSIAATEEENKRRITVRRKAP